jgi:hypothetical protein
VATAAAAASDSGVVDAQVDEQALQRLGEMP